jgi:hypothetical protein
VSSTARQYRAAHRSELSSFAQRYLTQNQTTLDTAVNIDAPQPSDPGKYQKLSLAHNFLSNVGSQFNFYSVKTERAGQSHNSDIHLNDLIGNYPIGPRSKSEEPTLRDKLHKKFLPKEKRPCPKAETKAVRGIGEVGTRLYHVKDRFMGAHHKKKGLQSYSMHEAGDESSAEGGVLKNAYKTFCKSNFGFRGTGNGTRSVDKSVDKSLSIDKTKFEELTGENLSARKRLKYKNQ